VKILFLMTIALLTILVLSGCNNNKELIEIQGKNIGITDDLIKQCGTEFNYNEATETWSLNICNDIPIERLEEFIHRKCKNRVDNWDKCEISFEDKDGYTLEFFWIDDKGQCVKRINMCYNSNYCELRLHALSDGQSSITWHTEQINESELITNSTLEYTLLGLRTWKDSSDYYNNRGVLYTHILNCYN